MYTLVKHPNTQKRAYPIVLLFHFFFSIRLGVDFETQIVWLKFDGWGPLLLLLFLGNKFGDFLKQKRNFKLHFSIYLYFS